MSSAKGPPPPPSLPGLCSRGVAACRWLRTFIALLFLTWLIYVATTHLFPISCHVPTIPHACRGLARCLPPTRHSLCPFHPVQNFIFTAIPLYVGKTNRAGSSPPTCPFALSYPTFTAFYPHFTMSNVPHGKDAVLKDLHVRDAPKRAALLARIRQPARHCTHREAPVRPRVDPQRWVLPAGRFHEPERLH